MPMVVPLHDLSWKVCLPPQVSPEQWQPGFERPPYTLPERDLSAQHHACGKPFRGTHARRDVAEFALEPHHVGSSAPARFAVCGMCSHFRRIGERCDVQPVLYFATVHT